MTQAQIDKLEKEKLEEIVVYTIDFGSYHHFSTTDKAVAYQLWEAVAGEFFELKDLGNGYNPPYFRYRQPVEVKLSAEKKTVWKSHEAAQRAKNAFDALSNKSKSEE